MQNIPVSSPFDMQPSAVYLGALSKKCTSLNHEQHNKKEGQKLIDRIRCLWQQSAPKEKVIYSIRNILDW